MQQQETNDGRRLRFFDWLNGKLSTPSSSRLEFPQRSRSPHSFDENDRRLEDYAFKFRRVDAGRAICRAMWASFCRNFLSRMVRLVWISRPGSRDGRPMSRWARRFMPQRSGRVPYCCQNVASIDDEFRGAADSSLAPGNSNICSHARKSFLSASFRSKTGSHMVLCVCGCGLGTDTPCGFVRVSRTFSNRLGPGGPGCVLSCGERLTCSETRALPRIMQYKGY
jgi:hypothetical protein